MTEALIKKILQEASKPSGALTIITRKLTEAVYLAKVWPGASPVASALPVPYTLYLLNDGSKEFVAAVQELESSLLFSTTKGYKSVDFIVDGLVSVILPHLFQHKAIQRLCLSQTELGVRSFEFHRSIAKAVGFKVIREEPGVTYFALESTALKNRPYISGVNAGINQDRIEEMRTQLNGVADTLYRMQVEMEMKNGFTYDSEKLGDIIKDVRSFGATLSIA